MDPFDKAARYAGRYLDPAGVLPWMLGERFAAAWQWTRWLDTQSIPFPGEPARRADTVAECERRAHDAPPLAVVVEFMSEPRGDTLERLAEYGLRLRGYEVMRNPLPFVYFDDEDAKLREWFYASANNCWVECLGDSKGGEAGGCRVFLPEYGFGPWAALKATDDANAAIWESLGFEVVRGGDFLPLADQLGSLNCVTRILARA